ncbi:MULTISPECIES: hypothetical protein [unclassified Lysobacter]|uniref:hypothetical protein n=1 Tax=unclassified Lysobacter TaxID=2635362 RepID=UPI001BE6F766|nr:MULTISPECIES: hypothetical protein [unclassified Lysobacter]MBT2745182.1 hypothetical protein [Lysobacter sp. ISL-42]
MNLVTHENSARPGAMSPIATRWLQRFELERELARIRYRLMDGPELAGLRCRANPEAKNAALLQACAAASETSAGQAMH